MVVGASEHPDDYNPLDPVPVLSASVESEVPLYEL